MLKGWIGHHHGRGRGILYRVPAGAKLAATLAVVAGTIALPAHWKAWFVAVGTLLVLLALASKVALGFLLKRLLLLSPFVLGVIVANAFRSDMRGAWPVLAARSGLCLFTVILMSNTTPFSQILSVLRRVRVPPLLITTLALMHRYLFVLVEESERMHRARASRSFAHKRRMPWRTLGSVVSHLFLRATERAERIYDAMCARGWK